MSKEIDSTAFSNALRQKAGIGSYEHYERSGRAEEVKATYLIEELVPGVYNVQHPIEDERSYQVDVMAGTCECPDFGCRGKAEGFWCKHLLTIGELTGVLPPEPAKTDYASWGTKIVDPDPNDPYQD